MKRLPKCYRCGKQPCRCPDGITLYHGDCREILPLLEPNNIDLVLTDPPYGIADSPLPLTGSKKAKRKGAINIWHDNSEWDKKWDPEFPRLCGSVSDIVVWFGNWKKRRLVEDSIGLPIRAEVVWAKDTHCGPPCPLAMQDERIWLFSRKGFTTYEFATTVWSIPIIPTWEHRNHKNEKPIPLMRRVVRVFSGEGQTILDPFIGSGSTLVAAKGLRRKAIGIEVEEKYCRIAAKRLEPAAKNRFLLM